jgi:hypothetical protein
MKLFFFFILLLASSFATKAQSTTDFPVTTGHISITKLEFTKHWAYPWYVIKHPNGKFENTMSGKIKKADTTHLYFTANCQTNVMGGYKLRYCFANKNANSITLKFADGAPAYENEFLVYINKNDHSFEPKLISPALVAENNKTYRVIKSKLNLDQQDDDKAEILSGYIDTEFTETTSAPKAKPITRKYYFRGYFKTEVKPGS